MSHQKVVKGKRNWFLIPTSQELCEKKALQRMSDKPVMITLAKASSCRSSFYLYLRGTYLSFLLKVYLSSNSKKLKLNVPLPVGLSIFT